LAYPDGNTSGWPAGAPRRQSESLDDGAAQPGGVAADTDEQRRRCPLAPSHQVAAGPSRKLTGKLPAQSKRSRSLGGLHGR